MKFFRDVVSHLLKNAFEAHTQFSVADNTAVGDNPIRSITLDAVPLNESTMISLSWEGGEKLFEKNLPEQEAAHQFDLISTDLAEVAALTKQGQYDAAKDLMKKLGQKYAENTGDIVDTNLPKLHNTQAAHKHEDLQMPCDKCYKTMCPGCGWSDDDGQTYHNHCKKMASVEKDPDSKLWKQAKITMQNLWFSTTDELLDYQKKQKGATPGNDQDHIPLWDKQKSKTPGNEELAPASLSYEDAEKEQEKDHEDMQKHIDEKIKTELESALQEKAASVFGPDQIELVKVLRKNGRNWDEIKKILVKDFGFDKDSTNIFVDEQRQGSDPTGIEVEPVKEDEKEKPLTPPEELVSPETHDKLLQDHEDKKKDKLLTDTPIEDESAQKCTHCDQDHKSDPTIPNVIDLPLVKFRPEDIMGIPEIDEIARADNDEIHKVAAPNDLNPLQEPLTEAPTTPVQDVVPMGKPQAHDAPQKGDRVFVSSDLTGEKAGFEGTFISNYKSKGVDFSIVETDDGDLLDVESHRVAKTSEPSGAQEAEPAMEPIIPEQQKDQPIQVTPTMEQLHSSLDDEALAIKAELDEMVKIVKEAESSVIMPMMYGIDDESILQYANGSIYANKIQSGQMTDEDWYALVRETGRWMTQVGRQNVSQTFSQDAEWKLDPEQIGKLQTMFNVLPKENENSNEPPPVESESSKKQVSAKKKCEICNEQFTPSVKGQVYCSEECCDDDKQMTDEVTASLKKEAGTTWQDLRMPEPPQPGWRVQHKSGLTGTVVDGSDKFANVKLDQKIKNDEATCRQYDISWVQLERGDHPKGIYAIYAGDGFGSWGGSQPNWIMTDSGGKPVYPKGYQAPKPMEHDKNPNPEPAIDTESAKKEYKSCPSCGGLTSSADVCLNCLKPLKASVEKNASSWDEIGETIDLPNHYKVMFVHLRDSYGPDAAAYLIAQYDLNDQLNNYGTDLNIMGPEITGDRVANAADMDSKDVSEELAYRLEAKWPAFVEKIKKLSDPLSLEMREQLLGEVAIGHEDELKQELAKAQQNVDQLKQQLGELGVSAAFKNLLKKRASETHPCNTCGKPIRNIHDALTCSDCLSKKASDFEKGISQNKTADPTPEEHIMKCPSCGKSVSVGKNQEDARCSECLNKSAAPDPTEAPKTQFKDYKITPKYTPKEQAIPATPELDAILSKMDVLHQNLATLEAARKQIQAKMNEEMAKIDEQGQRVEMEAALQESVEKAAVLINAVETKVVQWKDKLFTLQTEDINYVPKLTQKELLAKIYTKFEGAEKYVKDVLNGMLSLGKMVTEKTLVRWPNKRSELNKEATVIDDFNAINDELLQALRLLSEPI